MITSLSVMNKHNHVHHQQHPADFIQRARKKNPALSTLSLVFGLCLIVSAQFIIFPLLFTTLVRDPYELRTTPGHEKKARSASFLPNFFGGGSSGSESDNGDTPSTASQYMLSRPHVIPSRKRRIFSSGYNADGTFNGVPVFLKTETDVQSKVHCVGENYRHDAWKYRSCRFNFMCFNTTSKDYQIFQSYDERVLSVYLTQRVHMHSSTTMLRFGSNNTQSVAIGGINQKWNKDGIQRMKWFPKIVHYKNHSNIPITYYELPPETVLIPFHSFNGANPGHLVWDDLLPIYTLLSMFQLSSRELLLMRYVLQDNERGLWASCDVREEKRQDCKKMMNKFLPLLIGYDSRYQFSSNIDYEFATSDGKEPITDIICSRTGVAGIGSLTDHGTIKSHGWEQEDYELTHNHGRGGLLYDFRNFMVYSLGLPLHMSPPSPHRIVFSQRSSDIFIRSLDFERQMELVRESFPTEKVENYTFKELTLHEQVEIASQTSIYVTLCGGGAVTAMFLPRGSSVIVYYGEDSGTSRNQLTGKPALLDWDLFNSMSHLRVHWFPRNSRKKELDETALVLLIQHELNIIATNAFD